MCAARGQRYVDPLNRCVPRLTRHESFVGVSRGSLLHSCGVWGAEVYNLRPFISAKVEACCPACPTFVVWRFFIRAFVGLIPRRHPLCTCQETYRRRGAGSSWAGDKMAHTEFAAEMSPLASEPGLRGAPESSTKRTMAASGTAHHASLDSRSPNDRIARPFCKQCHKFVAH